jgi:hypothetical protein
MEGQHPEEEDKKAIDEEEEGVDIDPEQLS